MIDKLRQEIAVGDIIAYPMMTMDNPAMWTYLVIGFEAGLSDEEKAKRRWPRPGDDGTIVAYQVQLIVEPEGHFGFGTTYRVKVDRNRKRKLGKPEQMIVLRNIIGEKVEEWVQE